MFDLSEGVLHKFNTHNTKNSSMSRKSNAIQDRIVKMENCMSPFKKKAMNSLTRKNMTNKIPKFISKMTSNTRMKVNLSCQSNSMSGIVRNSAKMKKISNMKSSFDSGKESDQLEKFLHEKIIQS
jgi:hypothetical protein